MITQSLLKTEVDDFYDDYKTSLIFYPFAES